MVVVAPMLLFAGGIALLLVGADMLVKGAGSCARNLSISTRAVGLIVFAFGSSAPELVVNIHASIGAHEGIVFGSIIGSNVFSTLGVLGLLGLVVPLRVGSALVRRQITFSLVVTLLLAVLCNDVFLFGLAANRLSQLDGGVLLFGGFQLFMVYLLYLLTKAQSVEAGGYQARIPDIFGHPPSVEADDAPLVTAEVAVYGPGRTASMIAMAAIATVLGGYLVVENCARLAQLLAIRQQVIALTLIAVGASVPELLVSLLAARRGHIDMAVANIVGSNTFNIVFVLGASAVIYPAPFDASLNADLLLLCAATLGFRVLIGRRRAVQRWAAGAMIAAYAAYLGYVLWRG